MLIDCFPYFNEKELLELRIETLYDHVDGFLITDANRTHRGEPKEFSCVNTLRELGIPEKKSKFSMLSYLRSKRHQTPGLESVDNEMH